MKHLVGKYQDEVSFFTQVSKIQFQAEPVYKYEELEKGEDVLIRFSVAVSINDKEVSWAVGETKKMAKQHACRFALISMCKDIYVEWKNDAETAKDFRSLKISSNKGPKVEETKMSIDEVLSSNP